MEAVRELLGRIAAGEEGCLTALLSARARSQPAFSPDWPAMDRRTRALVQLAALLVSGADTNTLRYAVEEASATGCADAAIVRVLLLAAAAAGRAQAVAGAPRLALALDLDLGRIEGADSPTGATAPRPVPGPPPRIAKLPRASDTRRAPAS